MIIIYAQALKLQGKDDYWYEGQYHNAGDVPAVKKFFIDVSKMSHSKFTKTDEQTQIKTICQSDKYYFSIYCEEKEVGTERLSPIIIVCPKAELKQLTDTLNSFLKASKRSISNGKWEFIKKFIKEQQFERKTTIQLWYKKEYIAIVVCIFVLLIIIYMLANRS